VTRTAQATPTHRPDQSEPGTPDSGKNQAQPDQTNSHWETRFRLIFSPRIEKPGWNHLSA
ncbi:MAG TPA: hypothetical protein PLU80_24290, partial [Acidobacteriota bacterium]|nr:hypothetical protein [Acidobacteriota bacterium]